MVDLHTRAEMAFLEVHGLSPGSVLVVLSFLSSNPSSAFRDSCLHFVLVFHLFVPSRLSWWVRHHFVLIYSLASSCSARCSFCDQLGFRTNLTTIPPPQLPAGDGDRPSRAETWCRGGAGPTTSASGRRNWQWSWSQQGGPTPLTCLGPIPEGMPSRRTGTSQRRCCAPCVVPSALARPCAFL